MTDRVDALRWSTVVGHPEQMSGWRKSLHLLFWRWFKPSFVLETPNSKEIRLHYQGGYSSNAVLNDPILYKISDSMGTRRLWLNEYLPYAFLISNAENDSVREWCETCTSGRWMCVISRSALSDQFGYSVWLEQHNDALLCKMRFYEQIVSAWPPSEDDRFPSHKYGFKVII